MSVSESYPCPKCGTDVPDPGVRRDAIDAPGCARQMCPGCGSGLIRDPDAADASWREEPGRRMGGG
jgi:predicted RNA-binding Zn-ribbon protein involved in translation (DUF1610 family)